MRQLAPSRWFDISAAKRDIGYEPLVSMEDGMRRLKAWFEEQDRAEPEDAGKPEDRENPEELEDPEAPEDPDRV